MNVIHKFPIPRDAFGLDLPIGWKVVSVDMQGERPFMWVLLDKDAPKHLETFLAVATGEDLPEDADHVGTFHMRESELGHLVWHLVVQAGSPSLGLAKP